jgi:hypothetical protein
VWSQQNATRGHRRLGQGPALPAPSRVVRGAVRARVNWPLPGALPGRCPIPPPIQPVAYTRRPCRESVSPVERGRMGSPHNEGKGFVRRWQPSNAPEGTPVEHLAHGRASSQPNRCAQEPSGSARKVHPRTARVCAHEPGAVTPRRLWSRTHRIVGSKSLSGASALRSVPNRRRPRQHK